MQKGSYDAEKKTVTLQSDLVGNASKVPKYMKALIKVYFDLLMFR
jgi:hypothetical protein